jgi:hypothetical protein
MAEVGCLLYIGHNAAVSVGAYNAARPGSRTAVVMHHSITPSFHATTVYTHCPYTPQLFMSQAVAQLPNSSFQSARPQGPVLTPSLPCS